MPTILIIDDEADMRFAVRMLLERFGHVVIEAESGDAALARLNESVPDLALLDMRLPGMDGIQILEKIREKQKDLPVIMVTGYGNVELAEQAMKLGASHYLSKPFHNQELIDVIQKILVKKGVIGPEAPSPVTAPPDIPSISELPAVEAPSILPPIPLWQRVRVPKRWGIALGVVMLACGLLKIASLWKPSPKMMYAVPYSNPMAISFVDNSAWIGDWFSQAIYVHELQKGELVLKKTFYLPDVHLTGMAILGNAVYTADSWAHVLRRHRMDDHLSVALTVPSPGPSPCSLFWDGKYLWSCDLSTGKIYQHQADDHLTVVASFTSPGNAPVGFYKDDRWAWSMDAKTRQLSQRRLDNQLTIVATYQLPEWEEGVAPLSSFTWRDEDLWFTRTGKGFVYRRPKSQLKEIK